MSVAVLISIICVVLFSIVFLGAIIWLLLVYRKNPELIKSIRQTITRGKLSTILVVAFYAISFTVIGSMQMATSKTEKAYNDLIVTYNQGHAISEFSDQYYDHILVAEKFDDRDDEIAYFQYVTRQNVIPPERVGGALGWDANTIEETLLSDPIAAAWWIDIAKPVYFSVDNYMNQSFFLYQIQDTELFDTLSYSMELYYRLALPYGSDPNEIYAITTINNKNMETGEYYNTLQSWEDSKLESQVNGYFENPLVRGVNQVDGYDILQDDALERLLTESVDADGTVSNPFPVISLNDWVVNNNYSVGDIINPSQGIVTNFEIVGTYYTPRYAFPYTIPEVFAVDQNKQTVFLTATNTYEAVFAQPSQQYRDSAQYWNLSVGFNDIYDKEQNFRELIKQGIYYEELTEKINTLNDITSLHFSHFASDTSTPTIRHFQTILQINSFVNINRVNVVIFLIVVSLVMILLINKRVKDLSKQVGTLKAMGVKTGDIAVSWLIFPTFIIVTGFILSLIFALPLAIYFSSIFSGALFAVNIAAFSFLNFSLVAISFIIPLFVAFVVSWVTSYITLKKPTNDLLTNKVKDKPGFFTRTLGKHVPEKAPFTLNYQVNSLFKSMGKSVFLVTSLFLGTFIACFAFSALTMTDTLISAPDAYNSITYRGEWSNTTDFTEYKDVNDDPLNEDDQFDFNLQATTGPWYTDDISSIDPITLETAILDPITSYLDADNSLVSVDALTGDLVYSYIPFGSYFTIVKYSTTIVNKSSPTDAENFLQTVIYSDTSGGETTMDDLLTLLNTTTQQVVINLNKLGYTFSNIIDDPTLVDEIGIENIASNLVMNDIYLDGNYENVVNSINMLYSIDNLTPIYSYGDIESLTNDYFVAQYLADDLENYVQDESFATPLVISKQLLQAINLWNDTAYGLNDTFSFNTQNILIHNGDYSPVIDLVPLNFEVIGIWDIVGNVALTLDSYIDGALSNLIDTTYPGSQYNFTETFSVLSSATNDNPYSIGTWVVNEQSMLNLLSTSQETLSILEIIDGGNISTPVYTLSSLFTDQLAILYSVMEIILNVIAIFAFTITIILVLVAVKEITDSSAREVALLKSYGYSNLKSNGMVLGPFLFIISLVYGLAIFFSLFILDLITTLLATGTSGFVFVFALSASQIWILSILFVVMIIFIGVTTVIKYRSETPLKVIQELEE